MRLPFTAWLADELVALDHQHLRRRRRVCRSLTDGWCEVDGQRLRNFAGNDYLNLAGHPQVIAALTEAAAQSGAGARASALVSGRTPWQAELEAQLADFEGEAAAIVFPTGMAANAGTITALAGPDDIVFCDRFNHASLVDGCRLSGARFRVYRHDDLDALAKDLAKAQSAQRRWIVTDTVFSMDGDLAPLPELCRLAEEYDAQIIADEAHGTGVFGATGRGVAELQGVADRVAVRIGTLSKALGAQGGFVAGPQVLIDWLWNRARTHMYSTALAPPLCAAAGAALTILREEPQRIAELDRRCRLFRAALQSHSIEPLAQSVGPIVPIPLGTVERTMSVAERLERSGYLVGAIRPPTVPQGGSRLRVTITLAQNDDALHSLAAAIAES